MNIELLGNETVVLKLSESEQLRVLNPSIINRGFLFGDGLFETMILSDYNIRFKEAHIERLHAGCKILHLNIDNLSILNTLETFINNSIMPKGDLRIRWNVYRNGLGRYTPESNHTSHLFMLQNYNYTPPVIKKAYISQDIRIPSLAWSSCKTLNAMVYVMANLERKQKQFDEVILLNGNGYICEAGAANLFWIRDSVYYTPSLLSNCIAGIGRKAIIKELKDRNEELIQGEFKQKDLLSADQIFTSNVTGINYISNVDMREFDTSPIPFLEKLFYD